MSESSALLKRHQEQLAGLHRMDTANPCFERFLHAMVERIESRRGLRQLSYMKELKMGNDRYRLIDIDEGDAVITAADAVADVRPFVLD